MNWTEKTDWSVTDGNINSVCYGNGLYFATTNNGLILKSTDGETWTSKEIVSEGNIRDICYCGGKRFIAVDSVDAKYYETTDCWETWKTGRLSSAPYGVCYGNNTAVIVQSWMPIVNTSYISYKVDGSSTFTGVSVPKSTYKSVCYGNGLFVAVGSSGIILTSEDGMTWTQQTSGVTTNLNSVSYGDGLFVVVGDSETVLISWDGITWNQVTFKTGNFYDFCDVTYGYDRFIIVGVGGTIYTFNTDLEWEQQNSSVSDQLNGVCYGKAKFVSVGNYGTITISNKLVESGLYSGIDNEYKFSEVYVAQDGEYKLCEVYVGQDGEYKLCGG